MTAIPGGKYAVGKFKSTDKQVGEAWTWLLRDWLPWSGMQLDSRPFFEHYATDATYDRKDRRIRMRDLHSDHASLGHQLECAYDC
jgi:DNA gyrase inhibitor GyrI